jgi:hypothetical protein
VITQERLPGSKESRADVWGIYLPSRRNTGANPYHGKVLSRKPELLSSKRRRRQSSLQLRHTVKSLEVIQTTLELSQDSKERTTARVTLSEGHPNCP